MFSTAWRLLVCAALLTSVSALRPTTASAQPPVDWGDLDFAGLEDLGALDREAQLTFLFGLRADRADRAAFALSTNSPRDPAYGDHLTLAEVVERFGAPESASDAVIDALASSGHVGTLDPTRTYVEATMSVADAEALLSSSWHTFEYPESSFWAGLAFAMPTTTPTLPTAMQPHVERVHGAVVQLVAEPGSGSVELPPPPSPSPHAQGVVPLGRSDASAGAVPAVEGGTPVATGTPSGCDAGTGITFGGERYGLTPNQVLTAYGIDDLHAMGIRGQGRSVAIVDDSEFDPAWLSTFRECFGLSAATAVTPHVVGEPGTSEATETILDVSVMSAVAPELDRLDVYMVGSPAPGPTNDQALNITRMFAAPLNAALGGAPAPDVISASFGLCEVAPVFWQGRTALVAITEDILATAAAAGISWAVSTGDSGSSGCEANFRIPGTPVAQESVQYPGSSAWVTAVGGTNATLDEANEIVSSGVWNDADYPAPYGPQPSGGTGGASGLVARPIWQDPVASISGPNRSVPDIALFADSLPGYAIFGPGGWEAVGGTSAATPLFAGVLALLGQAAEVASQPVPGFANPLIYELGATGAAAVEDITLGDNDVLDIGCCNAAEGFDLASGWGSPRASALASELAAPTVSLGATTSQTTASVTLEATVTVPGGEVLDYEWDLDGDGIADATTTEPTYAAPLVAGAATSRADEPAVAGAVAVAGTVATVTVTTSLGRTASGSTSVPSTTPAPVEQPAGPAPLTIAG